MEVAALTREMLIHLGFTVIHAASAAAALGALADGRPIDIVLSDIMMPGGNEWPGAGAGRSGGGNRTCASCSPPATQKPPPAWTPESSGCS